MPRRRGLKPCPKGSACPYQNEGQHTSEFSHGADSDAIATKQARKQATAWKKSGGQKLGASSRSGGGRTLGGGGRVAGGAAPGRLARGGPHRTPRDL